MSSGSIAKLYQGRRSQQPPQHVCAGRGHAHSEKDGQQSYQYNQHKGILADYRYHIVSHQAELREALKSRIVQRFP